MDNLADALESEQPRPTKPLDISSCWQRLRGVEVGHLAVVVDGNPEIFPVNFVVERESVVFRTAEGTKLRAVTQGRVAFEVDGYDAGPDEAWSVIIKGTASEIRELEDLVDAAGLPLAPLSGTPKTRFVRIEVEEITGRRFPVVDPAMWRNPFTLRRRSPQD
ncbi:pyridoxamine 5'-phosphate oxidase family protein [Kineosporia sp. NBRC 101731]|uniref:pyridoxamine 5'-phosphate oxidase family protein n=1 Tax=Kineosporia sp. NBRC 101731 TaxID=3032199 RepID=UPI0024A3A159|nr:pyridoxamine 5'-phosphate oxidase family protein [Kineosporia sp. NBRC 101731]GLY30925.1 pyridoxamine 5'-phosphate oxidase [Kineosporia sp. NBRC 101731]